MGSYSAWVPFTIHGFLYYTSSICNTWIPVIHRLTEMNALITPGQTPIPTMRQANTPTPITILEQAPIIYHF